jgi:hypothetical protein
MAADTLTFRSAPRVSAKFPVIFAGAPFVGEGKLANLSLTGCAVTCDRTVLNGSYIKLRLLLPQPIGSLHVELGRIRWVRNDSFGVEFIRLPTIARQPLGPAGRARLNGELEASSKRSHLL